MVGTLMTSALVFLGLLRIKVFWNNIYDVLKFVHDVTKTLYHVAQTVL